VQTHGVEGLVDLLPCGNEVIALAAQAVRTVSISASLASTDPVKKTLLKFPIYTGHVCARLQEEQQLRKKKSTAYFM
jgi:hypothetical protein